MKKYNESEQEAYDRGFRAVYDNEAYNERYFIRDGLIWIHDIDALMKKLYLNDEDELRELDYDVDEYYVECDMEEEERLSPRQKQVKALGSKILNSLGSKKDAINILIKRYHFSYSTARYAIS